MAPFDRLHTNAYLPSIVTIAACYIVLPRDAMHSKMSVCPSIRPSHAGIVSKWLNVSSNLLHQ